MSLIKKGLLYFREHGIISTFNKTIKKCLRELKNLPLRINECFIAQNRIQELHEKVKNKTVYLVIPCIDWSLPLFQRPHQIAVELSKRVDAFVFFLPDQYQYDSFCFDKMILENLYLYSIHAVKYINEILSECREVIVFMTWTRHYGILAGIRYDKLIYDYVDEMNLFYYYNEQMENTHRTLLRQSNLTVVTANKLYDKAKAYSKKVILCENACDYQFFFKGRGVPVNPLISSAAGKYALVLGYYGCLAYWFDYETILWSARRRPDWLFVLVGYDFDRTLNRVLSQKLSNILYISARPYHELPSFVNGFDIALVPFVLNEVTEATSPIKIFEYMAAGKPILTSDLPECRKYRSVRRYIDCDDFLLKAESLKEKRNDPDYIALLEQDAKENTWEVRVNRILQHC